MELKEEQLRKIRTRVLENSDLSELLKVEFPGTEVSIIMGYDTFSEGAYTRAAFFSEDEAIQVMTEIPSNGTEGLSDSYHVMKFPILFLEEGRVSDVRTGQPLDDIDKKRIYSSLKERLNIQS